MDVVAVNNFGDTRSGGLAGPMGAFIIVLMCIAVVLLIRNMNKRLRRLPDSFAEADAKRRAAENARTERSPVGPAGARFDADHSADPATSTEPEVSGTDRTGPPAGEARA